MLLNAVEMQGLEMVLSLSGVAEAKVETWVCWASAGGRQTTAGRKE